MFCECEGGGIIKDFFISYTGTDEKFAIWVAKLLEDNAYSVVIQAWDFGAGDNFVSRINESLIQCKRLIVILSENYLKSKWCEAEWTAKLAEQISLNERRIVPIRIEPIEVKGLLKPIVYIDIVDKLEEDAKKEILDKLSERREKKVYEYPSYYNIQHIEIDNDYYVNDDHIIFIKTCKSKILRKGMKKIHNRITWFADEGIELYALSEGTSIEKLDMHDTNTNYNVVFDRELNVNEEVEYCVKAILTNNHKHFKNFFSSEIITPINNLNIHLHIDNENVKKVFTQKISDSPMNVRTEESKEHSLLHTFHWHIEKPELHFEYKVYW